MTAATRTPPTLLPASVPAAVRDAWAALDAEQRAALLATLAELDDPGDRDRLLGQLAGYARRATARPPKLAPAAATRPAAATPDRPAAGTRDPLSVRADRARLGAARWLVQCRDCGELRPTTAPAGGRLPLGLCPICHRRAEGKRAERRRACRRVRAGEQGVS